jgi:pilus assembly protein Flp/PilA
MGEHLRNFLADESGTTAIEYALIASGIAGAIFAVFGQLGSAVTGLFTNVKNALG